MGGKTAQNPRKNGGIKGSNPHLKEMRRREAKERNEAWEKLAPEKQLKSLEERFPNGAKRQKARILAKIELAKRGPKQSGAKG